MPKKRRQSHIPQQATRRRRTVRRPEFQPAPDAQPEQPDEPNGEQPPSFADEPPVTIPAYGATGPVETRPHWRDQTQQREAPARQRRRTEQLQRTATQRQTTRSASGQLPVFERHYMVSELRRITATSVALFSLVVVLALVLR